MQELRAALSVWWLPLAAAPFVGSFLGVLVMRIPEGKPIVCSRSRCDRCGQSLGPLDLIPILSWLASCRRCRHCGASLGWFYPAIEIGALAVAAWAATETSAGILWASCLLGWTLLALAVIDGRHLLLPDVLTVPLAAAGLIVAALLLREFPVQQAVGAAAGYASFTLIGQAYRLIRGRYGLGPGDATFLAASGAWVSWQGLPSVVLIAAVSALTVVLASALIFGMPEGSRRLAFGPYLCLGTWLVWLYGPMVLE